jgi:hypothetical protein
MPLPLFSILMLEALAYFWSSQRLEFTVSGIDPLAMRQECLYDNVRSARG